MKKITLIVALSLNLLIGCSDEENVVSNQQDQQTEEKTVFKFDFENGTENFKANSFGDVTQGKPVINLVDEKDSKCGTLYRGKTADFTEWKGYDFKGNDTQFLGLDMGACLGFFEGVVETDFEIKRTLVEGKAKLAFKYYMPGDFTGWNSGYFFNVYIDKADADYSNGRKLEDAFVKLAVKVNQKGWVDFSEDISVDLLADKYKLIIQMIGSSAAIDDIRLIEVEN